MSRHEVEELVSRVPDELWGDRQLMVGVLVSSKTMRGEQNKWPGRYPKQGQLDTIFTDDPHCLNLLHFNTDNRETLGEDMIISMRLAGPNCHGFQLNVRWPDLVQLKEFRRHHPDARIVLQLGSKALDEVGWERNAMHQRVYPYVEQGLITDVLIDPSGGEGIYSPFDRAIELLDQCSWISGDLGYGYAGGLRAERLVSFASLNLERYSRMSIDAEGQLRFPLEDKYNNQLDLYAANAYLHVGLALFNSAVRQL
jgi:hypothetical protein